MARDLKIIILITQGFLLGLVHGHARLLNPPSRASKWRMGFSMPAADYDDNQGYCGGRSRLWNEFGGKCGVCGDAFYPIPRAHERGGRYYTGEITKEYEQGEIVEADVEVTANHRGWFEFRICPYDNPGQEDVERASNGKFIEVSQRCLDKHPIPLADGSGYKYHLPSPFRRGIHTVKLRLPYNLVCTKCLFQWKYNTGNSWGKSVNGTDCMGCGHQEQFYSCADVKITASAHGGFTARPPQRTRPWDKTVGPQGPATDDSPSFWTRVPGSPVWKQNPAYTTSTTPAPSSRPRIWPWWFFDREGGWFNRDAWATSTVAPPVTATETWEGWTNRPHTTRLPFWNRWFLEKSTKPNPQNIPLVPMQERNRQKKVGFWERLFSRNRQNFWAWFFNGRLPGIQRTDRRHRKRPRPTRRTTTTTTTTTPRPTTTKMPWWKWWDNSWKTKTTTQAPRWRSWWHSWPWARVWDKAPGDKPRTTPRSHLRWRTRTRNTKPSTRPTTRYYSEKESEEWQEEHNSEESQSEDYNYSSENNNYNDMGNNNNNYQEHHEQEDSDVAQTSSSCYPVGIWTTLPGMKQWCVINCAAGFCPAGYCSSGCKD